MGYDLTSLNRPEPSEDEIHRLLEDAMARHTDIASHTDMIRQSQACFDALESTGSYFRFSSVAWPKLLELARKHGWTPRGETGREISDEDAFALADALEKVLETLKSVTPFQSSVGHVPPPWMLSTAEDVSIIAPRHDLSPEAFWATNPAKIDRFIRFARQGRFSVS